MEPAHYRTTPDQRRNAVSTVSVVVPVYRGESTVRALAAEIAEHRQPTMTAGGRAYSVTELILVWDRGPDQSDVVLRDLAETHDWIRVIWLARNYGQHAATVAGMAASSGEWLVTMDEDGQHDPSHIGALLDAAFDRRANLVYGAPSNRPPHGFLRNIASRFTKTVFLRLLSGGEVTTFHSYRLISGDAGRAAARHTGPSVYLDVALNWVAADTAVVPLPMRTEGREAASYRFRTLISHFWRLVLSSGNRPLRIVSGLGAVISSGGILYSIWLILGRLRGEVEVAGWASTMVALLIIGGLILISLGVIAEYVGLAASASMGRPFYVTVEDPGRLFAPRMSTETDRRVDP